MFFKWNFRWHRYETAKLNDVINIGRQWDLAQFRLLKQLTSHAATV